MDEEETKKKVQQQEERKDAFKNQMILDLLQSDRKAEPKALTRRLYTESKQANYAKGFTKAQEGAEWRRKEVMQDVALAQEILAHRVKEERATNRRHVLRESQELQELQSRIKSAYTQKELYTQLEAKKAEKIRTELEQQEECYRLKAFEDAINSYEEKRKIEMANKKREYREYLQDQIIEKHKEKVKEYKESLEDKAILDDALKEAEEADKRDEENRLKRIQDLKNDIEEFNRCRQVWMMKEKEKEEEEERKIKEYLEDKFRKEQFLQELERRKEEAKLRFHEAVVKVLKEAQGRRLEEERINQILLDEASRQKEEAKLKAEFEKKMKMKKELREIFAKQIEDKLQCLEEERKHDYEYCQELLKVQEENKLRDKELAEKKLMEKCRYAQELKQVIEERDKVRQRDLYRRIEEYHDLIKENKNRLKEIDDERLRMLQEHGTRLLGFLPKGIIRNSDLPYLDPSVQQYYNYRTPDNN